MSSEEVLDPFLRFVEQQAVVTISDDAIQNFSRAFIDAHLDSYKTKIKPVQMPLRFACETDEINFVSVLHILSIGSMYEHRSVEAGQPSLSDVVLFGIFGAFIAQNNLDAAFMRSMTASDIGQLFSLPMTEKVDLDDEHKDRLSFVQMEKRGGLADLADVYATALTHCGDALNSLGHKDMASLLLYHLKQRQDAPLEQICREVSGSILALDDRHFVSVRCTGPAAEEMSELCFLKNVRRMVHEVCVRFAETWGSTDLLSAADGLLAAPSVRGINALISLGILQPPEDSTVSSVPVLVAEGGVGSEVALRAAAVVACHKLAIAINHELSRSSSQHPHVSPISISIYLDTMNTGDASANGADIFIPSESGRKW